MNLKGFFNGGSPPNERDGIVKNAPTGFRLAAGLLVTLALASSGLAQTMYVEGFEDNGPTRGARSRRRRLF